MAKDLDEQVTAFRTRPLVEGPHTFAATDALTMKVREGGRVVKVAVMVATGVNADAYREVLGIHTATTESGAGWLAFFRDLVARGLSGVALVTSDAHTGLVEAIGATAPGASWQRCRTHYAANLMSATPKSSWPWVKALLHSVYDQLNAESVHAQFDRIIDALTDKLPTVAEHLQAARRCELAPGCAPTGVGTPKGWVAHGRQHSWHLGQPRQPLTCNCRLLAPLDAAGHVVEEAGQVVAQKGDRDDDDDGDEGHHEAVLDSGCAALGRIRLVLRDELDHLTSIHAHVRGHALAQRVSQGSKREASAVMPQFAGQTAEPTRPREPAIGRPRPAGPRTRLIRHQRSHRHWSQHGLHASGDLVRPHDHHRRAPLALEVHVCAIGVQGHPRHPPDVRDTGSRFVALVPVVRPHQQ
jgi:hypothetical protein